MNETATSPPIVLWLSSRFGNIELAEALLSRVCRERGLSEEREHWVGMSLRDALANAIKHGSRKDAEKRVLVTFRCDEKTLSIEVGDEGAGFSPEDPPEPLAAENQMKSSGRGIFYMRNEHAVCFIDLDMFKADNDTSGHIAGDELLRQISILLLDTIRKTDSLARLGGDEFGLLLQSCDMEKAKTIAENVLSVIEGFRFHWENHSFSIGASIGIAPILPDSGTLMSIMQTADFACYSAKDAGRNRVYAADLNSDLLQQRQGDGQWMSRLNDAIDLGSFVLYAQDIVPLTTINPEYRHVELLLPIR